MNKKQEFIDRLSQNLTRFQIVDKFHQMDTHTARFKIAEMCYNIMEQMLKEQNKEDEKIAKAQEQYNQIHDTTGEPNVENQENKDSGN
jgi:hypothetical protein